MVVPLFNISTTKGGWKLHLSQLHVNIAVAFCLGGRKRSQPSNNFLHFLFHGMAYLATTQFSLKKLYYMEKGFNKSPKSLKEKAEWKAHTAIFHWLFLMCKYNSSPLLLAGAEEQLMKQC